MPRERPNTGKPPGRPKGAKNKDKIALEKKAESMGKTPLDIMLESAVELYKAAQKETDVAKKYAFLKDASDMAAKAAPYIHRKMPQAVENKDVTHETWEQFCQRVEQEKAALNGKSGKAGANAPGSL